jgi:hypothetical protein
MPKPFHQLSLGEFVELLHEFPFQPADRIQSVHMHHTWRPNHSQYKGQSTINAMWEFHTQTRGWSDIAQHITIAPDGTIWTGRSWNQPPASASGFNGSSIASPFMFEIIGDFDRGKDPFTGAQKKTVLSVIAHVQKRFGLAPKTLRFHNMMSEKSCPGSALEYDTVLREVAEVRADIDKQPRAAGPKGRAPFEDRMRRVKEIIRQLENAPRAVGDEGEGCGRDAAQKAEFETTTVRAPEGSRGSRNDAVNPEVIRALRPHVINLNAGRFSTTGEFQTTAADVDAIFEEHLTDWARERDGKPLPIVFYAHGGLVSEHGGLMTADAQVEWWMKNGVYPIHFIWETGLMETLEQLLNPARQRGIDIAAPSDYLIERLARAIGGVKIWSGMKVSAERAADADGGARYAARKLQQFCARPDVKERVQLHAIGHSAGSIFHAHFIPAALEEKTPEFRTVQFLAPAIRVDTFERQLLPLVGKGKGIDQLNVFTMARDFELADNCARVYRKSLLYLIYYALEPERKTPLLGLEESLRSNSNLKRLFNLDRSGKEAGKVVWSVTKPGIVAPDASTSRTHGGFDEDEPTMDSIAHGIVGRVEVPFKKPTQRAIGAMESLQSREPALAAFLQGGGVGAGATSPDHASSGSSRGSGGDAAEGGRRVALCVGIDRYPTAPLGGCVNDAQIWRDTFRRLGFEEPTLLLDEDATRSAIIDQLSALVTSARAGDVIAFQFAGHGTQLPDLNGDEAGGDTPGHDEALCPVDFDRGRFIIDDDLAALFNRIPAGVNVTVFADCCHSGSNTRLAIGAPPTTRAGANVRRRFVPATAAMKEAHAAFRQSLGNERAKSGRTAYERAREVLFAACRSREVALESDGHGHFTARATRLLAGGIDGMTNADFQARVVDAFGENSGQNPELHCAAALRSRRLLAPLEQGSATRLDPPSANGHKSAADWRDEMARLLEGAAQTLRR